MSHNNKTHHLPFRALLDADAGGEEGFLRARVCEPDALGRAEAVVAGSIPIALRRGSFGPVAFGDGVGRGDARGGAGVVFLPSRS